jgi:hypothetical protein
MLCNGGQAKRSDKRPHVRLHIRPEPGGAEIEAVRRQRASGVRRQDTAAQPVAGLKQVKGNTGAVRGRIVGDDL